MCKRCSEGSKARLFFRGNQASLKHLFKQSSVYSPELFSVILRAHGNGQTGPACGTWTSAWTAAVICHISPSCPADSGGTALQMLLGHSPPPPPNASGLHIRMCSTNCGCKVYDLQIFISGCPDRQVWCNDLTPDLQSGYLCCGAVANIQFAAKQRRFTSSRDHRSALNSNNKSSKDLKGPEGSQKTSENCVDA